jgi:cyclopropane fatty-acyl-phospholipid synthase-like methyltransferase
MKPHSPLASDLKKLDALLRGHVAPRLNRRKAEARILDLACGRCDEAETLINVVKEETQAEQVKLVGADIRIREIRQARERTSSLDAEFLLQDARQLGEHRELSDFDLVFLRHQNYWHGSEVWKEIFDTGLAKLNEDGLLVITSYFDKEHQLAIDALTGLGAQLVHSTRNEASRVLADAPGSSKSVDRHLAIFSKP